jgi:hypothetical protein
VTNNCIVCGKSFRTYLSWDKKYCSKKCSDPITLFKTGHISKVNSTSFRAGPAHPRWKGWRYCGRGGKYKELRMPTHPYAKRGYYREHRYVMEQKLGRYLTPEEEVHHIDGNGWNNAPENLRLIKNKSEHVKLEHRIGTYKHIHG